jgi:hypothetical protein
MSYDFADSLIANGYLLDITETLAIKSINFEKKQNITFNRYSIIGLVPVFSLFSGL